MALNAKYSQLNIYQKLFLRSKSWKKIVAKYTFFILMKYFILVYLKLT